VLADFTIPRGWISADVKVRGKTFRFVTGHLEEFDPGVNLRQGLELLWSPADRSMPVVMAADFNSGPNNPFGFTGTYHNIIAAGFDDTWPVLNPNLEGNTCCQLPDLSNQPVRENRPSILQWRDRRDFRATGW
jgi:endonuclease/exonuclease/phosphatase family metal-dependent hydrolase